MEKEGRMTERVVKWKSKGQKKNEELREKGANIKE